MNQDYVDRLEKVEGRLISAVWKLRRANEDLDICRRRILNATTDDAQFSLMECSEELDRATSKLTILLEALDIKIRYEKSKGNDEGTE